MFIYFARWLRQHGIWSLKAAQDGKILLFACSLVWSTNPKRLQSNETKCRPRQSFLSFQSYKYKVPCLSCPFCTLLGKSRVWKVLSPMFKLKRSERIWKYLQMFTQHTTICKFAPEVENNSWNLCAKWVTWSSSLMLHGKSYRFCFIVCIFCQKKNVRKQQSYLLPWPSLWRHSEFCMPANNSFAFPSCLQVSVTASSWNLDLPKTFEISLELLLLGAKIAKMKCGNDKSIRRCVCPWKLRRVLSQCRRDEFFEKDQVLAANTSNG